jgi:hypothetical protein
LTRRLAAAVFAALLCAPPAGEARRVELGLADQPGGAQSLRHSAPFGYRADFKRLIYGDGGASWWRPSDFTSDIRFDMRFSRATRLKLFKWQIPLGNTLMRAMNDTWGHYQDNRVQWLLGPGSRAHLARYRRAGVLAFLFGGGADGTTCACDARHDGATNPPPIDGNTRLSLSADDDGGYFRDRARAYYR